MRTFSFSLKHQPPSENQSDPAIKEDLVFNQPASREETFVQNESSNHPRSKDKPTESAINSLTHNEIVGDLLKKD
jgi:hypothetical protein